MRSIKFSAAIGVLVVLLLVFASCNMQSHSDKPDPNSTITPSDRIDNSPTENENKPPLKEDPAVPVSNKNNTRINYDYVKAIWITQYELSDALLDEENNQRDGESFGGIISSVLENIKSMGFNTVIIQMRPNCDSMYDSELFAPSIYAVGEYGRQFDRKYDPIGITVDKAHELGLSVHAWINPMRAPRTEEILKIPENYVIKQWWNDDNVKDKYLAEYNGRSYLNIGYGTVRELIVNGAFEIIDKYNVDGLHIDDYFYPTTDIYFDKEAYEENGNGMPLGDWRRNNVDTLVRSLYNAVKEKDENMLFGISPAADIKENRETLYADVEKWSRNKGFADYICPQIYFGFDHETKPFVATLKKWYETVDADVVDLIIGLTFEKALTGYDPWAGESGKDEWSKNKDIVKRSYETVLQHENCCGICVFSYGCIKDVKTGQTVAETQEEAEKFSELLNQDQ